MYYGRTNYKNVEMIPQLTPDECSFAKMNFSILVEIMRKHNVFKFGSDCGAIYTYLNFIKFWMLNFPDRGKSFSTICYIVLDVEIARHINEKNAETVLSDISPLYYEIIQLYAKGKNRRAIADDLEIPYSTVKNVLQAIGYKAPIAYFITKR